jgi:hypothetical protein
MNHIGYKKVLHAITEWLKNHDSISAADIRRFCRSSWLDVNDVDIEMIMESVALDLVLIRVDDYLVPIEKYRKPTKSSV